MQLRISRKSTDGKTYEYAQLVESYRRESDGMPMHRVVANLGVLSPLEIENWRTMLAAGRRGRRVVEARTAHPRAEAAPKLLANLRYLDVAVLLSIWDERGLTPLLADLLPAGQADVAPAVVVAALSIQRCVDPGSKLDATQWFPRSALPELLGIAPAAFDDTRVRRVLEEIERVTPALMGKLARHCQEHDRGFTAMFLDATDTWFVGHAPDVAELGKTKTIGMLALLLERTLQQRLGGTLSAKAAIDQLEPCRLNRYQASGGHVAYQVTELDRAQASILRTLGKRDLGESDVVTERITAR